MPESGSPRDVIVSQACALTRCGTYYLNVLAGEFTYFSAMASDTGIADQRVASEIGTMLRDNISGPKIPLPVRRGIAKRFVGYLDSKERAEVKGAIRRHPVLGKARFVPRMITALRALPAGS